MDQPAKQSLRSAETIPPRGATDSASVSSLLFVTLPTQFGRFRVERLLGQGAMGAVYLAWDTQLERAVALKVPRLMGAEDSNIVQRLLREAKAAASLDHPHICRVYDVGSESGTAFIAMQFIAGRPLSDYIAPGHFQSERRSVDLVRKLASALVEAHAKGIIHRDLKPANILVNESGEPILMDFGLARRADSAGDGRATQAGMLIGSPAYMSPEQANGEIDKIGPWSDLYSLGVLLFELLTNQLPFQGSVLTILSQIATKESPLPSSLRPGLDPRLDLICRRMMAKHPKDRFASMTEVEKELTSWLEAKVTRSVSEGVSLPPAASISPPDSAPSLTLRVSVPGLLASPQPASPSTASVVQKTAAASDDVARQEQQARKRLADQNYDAAIPLLTKLAGLDATRFKEAVAWAKSELPVANQKLLKQRERTAAACEKARALLKSFAYNDAVQLLEAIPEPGRIAEHRQLLFEASERADECAGLKQEIDEAVKRQKYDRLLPLVKHYLKLKPDNAKMQRLAEHLLLNRPARAVANYKETRRFFDVAGRLVEPKEVIMSAALLIVLFLPVYYFSQAYFDRSDNTKQAVPTADVRPSELKQNLLPTMPASNNPQLVQANSPGTASLNLPFAGTVAGRERDDNLLKMKFCWCPPGTFSKGSPATEPERGRYEDQVEVTLTNGFWMGKYEVTQGEWQQIMGTTLAHQKANANSQGDITGTGARHPMYFIDHDEAAEFCVKVTYQERQAGRLPIDWEYSLPTESQWEYAGRAGTTTATTFGNSLSSTQANFNGSYPYGGASRGKNIAGTTEVGTYKANDWGLCDMHGNVWEWCRDYDWSASKPLDGNAPNADFLRSTRGGSWSWPGSGCRSAFRGGSTRNVRSRDIGFRVIVGQSH